MNSIHRDIFKAIHEGKWLKIEYLNKEGRHTNYWIGIRDLDPRNKTLKVDGLHLNRCSIEGYDKIYIDSILSTEIVEGSYCPENERLIEDIAHQFIIGRIRRGIQFAAHFQIIQYF